MTEPAHRPVYYVVFLATKYRSLAEAMDQAPEDDAAHLARSKQLHEQGAVIVAGAFLDIRRSR